MTPKRQRMWLVGIALVAMIGAVLLAMWGIRDQASYFVTPTDIVTGNAPSGKAIRLGGMVEKGSLKKEADGVTIRFTVTDQKNSTDVRYRGITPDLFKEGSGVVAEGRLQSDGTFEADNILAKHDERYMPPQMADTTAPANGQ